MESDLLPFHGPFHGRTMGTAQNHLPHPLPQQNQPLLDALRHQIRKLETAGRASDAKINSTGCAALDERLPEKGLATGTLTEWLAPTTGYGAELLSLLAAREACTDGGALVVIDPENRFYPAAAAAWKINLENVVILRNTPLADSSKRGAGAIADSKHSFPNALLWAIDQSLRCPAVAAVWGPLGTISERWMRRFQLSAEQSGAMGMFVRPPHAKEIPSWSEVQFELQNTIPLSPSTAVPPSPLPKTVNEPFDRRLQIRLLRVRNGPSPSQPLTLNIDFTTGKIRTIRQDHEPITPYPSHSRTPHSMRLASQLAHPKVGRHQQRA